MRRGIVRAENFEGGVYCGKVTTSVFVFLVGGSAEAHGAVDGGEILVVFVADGLLSGATVVTLDYALAVGTGELKVA